MESLFFVIEIMVEDNKLIDFNSCELMRRSKLKLFVLFPCASMV